MIGWRVRDLIRLERQLDELKTEDPLYPMRRASIEADLVLRCAELDAELRGLIQAGGGS